MLLIAGALLLASAAARAQPADPIGDLLQKETQSTPDEAPVQAASVVHAGNGALSANDIILRRRAIGSARHGDGNGTRAARDRAAHHHRAASHQQHPARPAQHLGHGPQLNPVPSRATSPETTSPPSRAPSPGQMSRLTR